MEQLIGYIATGVISLVVGILLQRFAAKPRLLCWLPGSFRFELEEPEVQLQTDSLTIQNVGRQPATHIQIVHRARPDHFQFSTPIAYTEDTNPNGEHITKIESLGPKEYINIQYLSHTTLPMLLSVRSDHGQAKVIQVVLRQLYSQWVNYLASTFMVIGFGFIFYWLVMSVVYLSKAIGN